MKPREIKNDSKYFWTEHSKFKMRQYNLSPQRIKRVIKSPKRIEEGIVKNTIAVMQPASNIKKDKDGGEIWNQEIWAMYQLCERKASRKFKVESIKIDTKYCIPNTKYKIISAWRYPGVSSKNNPIPEVILEELGEL